MSPTTVGWQQQSAIQMQVAARKRSPCQHTDTHTHTLQLGCDSSYNQYVPLTVQSVQAVNGLVDTAM